MHNNKLLVIVIALAALVLGACAPAAVQGASAPGEQPRTLSVNGTGTVTLDPDIVRISLGVMTEASDATEVVNLNNTQTQQLIAALKDLGIADEDIATTDFSIYPRDNYDLQGQPTGEKVYSVQNTVRITVRELDNLGAILGAAVDAGANNVYGIQFDVADREASYAEAVDAAMQNANERAQALAGAASVELGDVYNVSTNVYGGSFDTVVSERALGLGGGSDVPIQPGQMQITVNVSVTYELK